MESLDARIRRGKRWKRSVDGRPRYFEQSYFTINRILQLWFGAIQDGLCVRIHARICTAVGLRRVFVVAFVRAGISFWPFVLKRLQNVFDARVFEFSERPRAEYRSPACLTERRV